MVPIYAIESWVALRFKEEAIYLEVSEGHYACRMKWQGAHNGHCCGQLAARSLSLLPAYASREILLIHGSHTSNDPGNALSAIGECVRLGVRVSVIALPGEVYLTARLARDTHGRYDVPENVEALRQALLAQCTPPPVVASEGGGGSGSGDRCQSGGAVRMGFPRIVWEDRGICACHGDVKAHSYVCPQCSSRCCEIPSACVVCGLQLVSAASLARSNHHLFPVARYITLHGEATGPDDGEGAVAEAVALSAARRSGSAMEAGPDGGRAGLAADAASAPRGRRRARDVGEPLLGGRAWFRCAGCDLVVGLSERDGSGAAGGAGGGGGGTGRSVVGGAAAAAAGAEATGPMAVASSQPGPCVCVECGGWFCESCDSLIHDSLHNCPGCCGLPVGGDDDDGDGSGVGGVDDTAGDAVALGSLPVA